MKTMIMTLSLLMTALAAAAPASAAGFCAGYCVDASTHTDVKNVYNTDTDVRTCAGNINVQIGLENEAHYCSEEGRIDPGNETGDRDLVRSE